MASVRFVAGAPARPHAAESFDSLRQDGRPGRAGCLLHNERSPKPQPRRGRSRSLAAASENAAFMSSAWARPGALLDYNQSPFGALPRRTPHLISAPLRRVPPKAAAHLLPRTARQGMQSEVPPFPLSNDLALVLAVQGSLRRFAPLTAPGPREEDHLIIGKRGLRSGVLRPM